MQMVISYGGGNNDMKYIRLGYIGHYVSILNHSYEAAFVLDEPTIISYKPQILFDTLPTVWQIFNLLGVTLQTLSAYYKVYMSQPNTQSCVGTAWTPTANRTDAI